MNYILKYFFSSRVSDLQMLKHAKHAVINLILHTE